MHGTQQVAERGERPADRLASSMRSSPSKASLGDEQRHRVADRAQRRRPAAPRPQPTRSPAAQPSRSAHGEPARRRRSRSACPTSRPAKTPIATASPSASPSRGERDAGRWPARTAGRSTNRAETGCSAVLEARSAERRPGIEQPEHDPGDRGVDARSRGPRSSSAMPSAHRTPGAVEPYGERPAEQRRRRRGRRPASGSETPAVNRIAMSAIATTSSIDRDREQQHPRRRWAAPRPPARARRARMRCRWRPGSPTRPPSSARAAGDRDRDQRGHDHAADGRERPAAPPARRSAQLADDQLALDLEPGDEEEDRQQAVGGPVRCRSRSSSSHSGPSATRVSQNRGVGVAREVGP